MFKLDAFPVSYWNKKNPDKNIKQSIRAEEVLVLGLLAQKAIYDERLYRALASKEGDATPLCVPFLACSYRFEHLVDMWLSGGFNVEWFIERDIASCTITANRTSKNEDLVKAGVVKNAVIAHALTPLARIQNLFSISISFFCSVVNLYVEALPWLEKYIAMLEDFEVAIMIQEDEELFSSLEFMFNCVQSLSVDETDLLVTLEDWRAKFGGESLLIQETKPKNSTLN